MIALSCHPKGGREGGGGGGGQGIGANLLLRHIIIVIFAAACPSRRSVLPEQPTRDKLRVTCDVR
jgi:hypothetical protein